MLCEFQRLIYPTSPQLVLPGTYTVASYVPCERVLDTSGKLVTQIKAVGYCLPLSEKIRYDMQGQWTKNSKFGLQFEVENYTEVIEPSREGIIGYLSSGQIKGMILEPRKIKSLTVPIVSPCICHEVMGPDSMIFIF